MRLRCTVGVLSLLPCWTDVKRGVVLVGQFSARPCYLLAYNTIGQYRTSERGPRICRSIKLQVMFMLPYPRVRDADPMNLSLNRHL